MIISFKLKNYNEICDDNEDVLSRSYVAAVGISRNERLEIIDYRIQIPSLSIDARQGYISSKDSDGWYPDCDIFAIYETDCEYLSEYQSVYCSDLETAVYQFCKVKHVQVEDISDLECIIDTDEFLTEDGKVKKTKKFRRQHK